MKISFEKKVFLGFVINLLVVIAAGGSSFRALIIKETKRWIRYWTG
jgi:CHASE3 domain sensor protein